MSSDLHVQLPQIPLFTLDPNQVGGRSARRGYEFQDEYIASVLARFLAGEEDFLAARIEGVEDLETITRVDDIWLERYYQIKSRQEGAARWTVAALHHEGIWNRFFTLYQLFVTQKFEGTRQIEFVIAVEGDLDADLVELREKGSNATSVKGKLLNILSNPPSGTGESPLRDVTGIDRIADAFIDGFISTLRFESRLGSLPETIFSRLMRAGDLSPNEARGARAQLIDSIRDECLRPEASLVTPQMLRSWLGVRERSILQKKPAREPHEVERDGLIANLVAHYETANALLLYGTPKIGKSHLISALLDHLHKEQDYFWFTFTGTDGDRDKFIFQLTSWVGERTGIRQIKDDIQTGSLQVRECLIRLKRTPVNNVYVVIDDCHKLTDKTFLEEITNALAGEWLGSKIVLISEEKIPEIRAAGIEELRIGGLEPKEGIFFLARLGVEVEGVLVELAMLCVQADGHPALLRAIASELPSRPSPEDISRLSQSLLTALSVTGDDGLSNAPTPGSETSDAWWCVTTVRSPSTARSFISPAS